MLKSPKSLRLQIGLFGRTNVGKSSFLNLIAGQDVSITSSIAGTTTDVVEKSMELLPIGPVAFLDTAGLGDNSRLAGLRLKKTQKVFNRADVVVLLVEPDIWSDFESEVCKKAKKNKTPLIVVINKIDQKKPRKVFIEKIKKETNFYLQAASRAKKNRNKYIVKFKKQLLKCCPDEFINPPPLMGDLMPDKGLAVLVIPIDFEAPKGRIILPQVQVIRDCLDHNQGALSVKENQYLDCLGKLNKSPDLVVCDSQVVSFVAKNTPASIKCTTFSIIFSRNKGDLLYQANSAAVIDKLKNGDKILIAEACSHHPIEGDIGRVKIPRWLRQYLGFDIGIDVFSGKDYPDNLSEYGLVIHCGGCMINRRQMLYRINLARKAGVPITNYGVLISYVQGVLKRVLSPFPLVSEIYERQEDNIKGF